MDFLALRSNYSQVSEEKPKGEWKSRILKEVQTSPGVKWRAQISISPDGTEFAGIRKVAVKKDGTEIMTKDGLSFKYDASTINGEVDLICGLLQALIEGKIKVQGTALKVVLSDADGNQLIGVSKTSGKVAHTGQAQWEGHAAGPRIFKDTAAAKAYREKHGLSVRDWKAKRI